jgi:hypothetical protein
MEKLYELPALKKLKRKYKVDTLCPFGSSLWMGELNDGDYFVYLGCYKNKIKVKMGSTEYEAKYVSDAIDIAKINRIYNGLGYLTDPPFNCEIKIILNLLEWEYEDDDIWC